MKMIFRIVLTIFLALILLLPAACADPDMSPLANIPLEKSLANGLPTVAEFGWRECIPCKAMRPILEELAEEYKDQV